MANSDSVTVSIAEETIGIFSEIPLVSCVASSVSAGNMALFCGTSRTSSKLNPSGRSPMERFNEKNALFQLINRVVAKILD